MQYLYNLTEADKRLRWNICHVRQIRCLYWDKDSGYVFNGFEALIHSEVTVETEAAWMMFRSLLGIQTSVMT